MATIEISFDHYVRGVKSSGPGAAVLLARLDKAQPPDMNATEKKAFKLVQARAHDVAVVLSARDRLAPGRLRPVLMQFGSAWTAMHDALSAKARIPASISETGRAAEAMSASLFPDAVSFAQLDAETAWSEGSRRLSRMATEHLESELKELVGTELLQTVKVATEALGEALGTRGDARETPSSSALQEALGLFGRAVGAYGRALAATCDEDDAESVQRFLKAVAPIDMHRANMRGGTDVPTTDELLEGGIETPIVTTTPSSNGVSAPVANGGAPHA